MAKVGERVGRPARLNFPRRTLVLVEDLRAIEKTHSTFLRDLEGLGHQLTILPIGSGEGQLSLFGENLYDNVLLLTPTATEFGDPKKLDQQKLLNAFDDEESPVNLLLVGGSKIAVKEDKAVARFSTGTLLRSLANQLGVDFDIERSAVGDHFRCAASTSSILERATCNLESLVASDLVVDIPKVFTRPAAETGGISYSGMGLFVSPADGEFAFPILRGSPSSYSAGGPRVTIAAEGTKIVMVAGVQGLNNARASVTGSLEMFSDDFMQRNPPNRQFAKELLAWTFGQSGVLSWSDLTHHKVDEDAPPYMYRTLDRVKFEIDLWTLVDHGAEWVPLAANDVQLEYTMLDPHIRQFLDPPASTDSATFSTTIKTPDRPGVFKFVLKHKRPGYSALHIETLAPQRNFKHNDYERFIWSASPYYGSGLSVLVALFAFGFVFLYHRGSGKHPFYYSTPDTTTSPASVAEDDEPAFETDRVAGKENRDKAAVVRRRRGKGA